MAGFHPWSLQGPDSTLALQSVSDAGGTQGGGLLAPPLACEGDLSVRNLGNEHQDPVGVAEVPGPQGANALSGAVRTLMTSTQGVH